MKNVIFTMDEGGNLNKMLPSAPKSEDFMQDLVGRYPEIICEDDGSLLLIRREQPIADSADTNGRWSLDHLFVTRKGVPVLVELKRAVDTRIRREVVGQMLDYAANGTAYWKAGRIAESFEKTSTEAGEDPDLKLSEFIDNEDMDAESFWAQVDANFTAGRIKLVFVADKIPSELARIVEFLNDQMRADVSAIELGWFESEAGLLTLAPRVIGQTERANAAKKIRGNLEPISMDDWLLKNIAPLGKEQVLGANKFIELINLNEGTVKVASTQGSIVAEFSVNGSRLHPFYITKTRQGSIYLCLGYLKSHSVYDSEFARQNLYDQVVNIVGPMSNDNISGYPSFSLSLLNDVKTYDQLQDVLRAILKNIVK